MRVEEVRGLLRAHPFVPFTVYTSDGGAIPVWHPDFGLLSPDGRTLWVYQKDLTFDMLDVMLLTRFRFNPPAEAENPAPAETP